MAVMFRNARVLTLDENDSELSGADVLVEGSKIAAIGEDLQPPAPGTRMIDASGKLIMPGLINAHLHSPANHLKGALDDAPLEIFMLYEVPPMGDTRETARLNYLRTILGAMEMLKLGITAVHDDAFFNPLPTSGNIDAVMSAYRDAGMRATVAIDQPNVVEYEKFPYLADLLPDDIKAGMRAAPRQNDEELLAVYGDFVGRWHMKADGRLRCSASCSAPQRVTPTYLQALTDFARTHDLPFNIHILETRLQRILGQERYGKSLIAYVDELGALDERKVVIHSIWVDGSDIARMARSGCSIVHNPISNMKIGSGVMPFRALRQAGIPIALGTDEAAVDDSANLWQVAKTAALLGRISQENWDHWPRAGEILECAITGGATSMRLERSVGRVAPGYEADLIMIDLDHIAYVPLNDLRRQLVFCENGAGVVLTMVAGEVVMEQGRLTKVNEAELLREIRTVFAENAAVFDRIHSHAQKLLPYYRAMVERAHSKDLGMVRRLPDFNS